MYYTYIIDTSYISSNARTYLTILQPITIDYVQRCQSIYGFSSEVPKGLRVTAVSIVNANVSWTLLFILHFIRARSTLIGMDCDTAITHKPFSTSEENTCESLKSIITISTSTDEILRSFSLNCSLIAVLQYLNCSIT